MAPGVHRTGEEAAIAASVTQCVKCHTPLPDNSRFCFACGADQTGGGVDAQASGPVELLQARLQRLVQGKYEILKLLGKGGMGAVFLANDLTLEREVAIKVLPPDFSSDPQVIKRFQQEAKTAAKLDHTNIIPIYRVESEEGLNYFVMKFISGTSLEDVLESKQPLTYDYVQRILWEAACALGHAHSRGVVHRDVKPANIMFDHDGRVMLTDFGISKALQSASGLTGTGMIIGTPHYMAPEQAKGQPVDGRADQYSLGVVGYRLLAGSLPFSGDSVHTILYKHIFEEAPRVSALRKDIPRHLTDPIQRALSKDPAERFPTMEDFATAIWPEQPVTASGKATPRPMPRRPAPGPRTGGPVTADAPTERAAHAAAAAAPTTPLPRPAPAVRPAPKRSSKAGLFVLLGVIALGVGGYVVWSGQRGAPGTGEPPATNSAVTPPAASPTPPATAQSLAVATQPADTTATKPPVVAVSPPSPPPPASDRRTTPRRAPQRQQPARQAPPPVVQQAAPAETQGFLTIDSDPFGTVFVDDVNVGDTPLVQYGLKPGPHVIRIESPGYKPYTERVHIEIGNTIRKRITLNPEG
ncbi:MAG TPA: protein kinase [Gemmatimonadales bacterium]|nr:protein kinase [Gemmatimonadales bacterium]